MCTLLIARDVVAPHTVLLAANRDEDPARPSDLPALLSARPRVAGGRDRVGGGTWLAVRERRAVVALLNRRPTPPGAPETAPKRSRGLLTLELAAVPADRENADFGEVVRRHAESALAHTHYAPHTLIFASPEACWQMVHDQRRQAHWSAIPPGWHVITHSDLDDEREPRTAWLLRQLAGFAPASLEAAEQTVLELLRAHGASRAEPDRAAWPPVCIHDGPMVTVSSATVWLSAAEARYRHAEGLPCQHAYLDYSHLLADSQPALEKS